MNTTGTDTPKTNKHRTDKLVLLDVLKFWNTDLPTTVIAKKLNVTQKELQAYGRRNKLPRRPHATQQRTRKRMIDPTPEEIAARAAECRAWRTEKENKKFTTKCQQPVTARQYGYIACDNVFVEIG